MTRYVKTRTRQDRGVCQDSDVLSTARHEKDKGRTGPEKRRQKKKKLYLFNTGMHITKTKLHNKITSHNTTTTAAHYEYKIRPGSGVALTNLLTHWY